MRNRFNTELISSILSENTGLAPNRTTRHNNIMKVAYNPALSSIAYSADEDYYDKMRAMAYRLFPELPEGVIEQGIFECAANSLQLKELERTRKIKSLDALGTASAEEKILVREGTQSEIARRMIAADLFDTGTDPGHVQDWHAEAKAHISSTLPLSAPLVEATMEIMEAAVFLEEAERRGEA